MTLQSRTRAAMVIGLVGLKLRRLRRRSWSVRDLYRNPSRRWIMCFITIERRKAPTTPRELIEVVTPRTNQATIAAVDQLLTVQALVPVRRAEPFSLEI